jgi:hypothetical protein
MFADRRRLLIGGAVIVVLVLAVWYQTRPAAEAPVAVAAPRARVPRGKPDPAAAEGVKPIRLDTLKVDRGEPSGTTRNPFRFQPKVVAPPPRPVAPPPEMTRPVAPPVPAGPPPAPPIPLKFIALVERASGVKWAVLSDGKVTMYGKDGDTIDGRYRIVKIGTESVEVTYLDGRGRQVIRLTGQ